MSDETATLVDKYIRLRDKKAEVTKRHKEEMAPYNNAMEKLENILLAKLLETGMESAKFATGTMYQSTTARVTVRDWRATLEFIREQDAWELLEARVSPTAAQAVVKELARDIPGVAINYETSINVRRPKEA